MSLVQDQSWQNIQNKYKVGDLIQGTVLKVLPFGVFLDIHEGPILGFIRIVNITDTPELVYESMPKVGESVEGIIVEFTDSNKQVCLSIKPSDMGRNEVHII